MRQEGGEKKKTPPPLPLKVSQSLPGSHSPRTRGYPRGEPRYAWYVTCAPREPSETRPEAGTPPP